MSLRRIPAALAASAALLIPVTAACADAPWSAPGLLVPGAQIGQAVPGAITLDGHAGAVSANGNGAAIPSQLVRLSDTGAVLADDPLGIADAHVAARGGDDLVIAGSSLGSTGTIDDTSHIRVAVAPGAGGAITTAPVHGSTSLHVAGVVANARGDIALVGANTKERVVYLRAAGHQDYHAVLTIKVDPSQARGATIALGAKGDVLVVWEDHHEVMARHRGTKGTWGSVATLGAGIQSDLSAAVDDTGRLLTAWKSQRVGEGESNTPAIVSFITAAPGHGWGSRRQIESVATAPGAGHYVASPGVLLDVADAHHALLTWAGINATNYAVKAMTITDGHTSAAQTLSPAGTDAVLGDATTAAGGPAMVLWRSGVRGADPVDGQTDPRLFASTRAAGATTFGAPEAISAPGDYVVQPPTALVASGTHAALALFAATPGGQKVAARPPIGG